MFSTAGNEAFVNQSKSPIKKAVAPAPRAAATLAMVRFLAYTAGLV
jgi:hypothetical protein